MYDMQLNIGGEPGRAPLGLRCRGLPDLIQSEALRTVHEANLDCVRIAAVLDVHGAVVSAGFAVLVLILILGPEPSNHTNIAARHRASPPQKKPSRAYWPLNL